MILAIFVAALFVWVSGLLLFIQRVESVPAADARRTDAIVVLTGGALRVEHGFALLGEGLADALLISGVGKDVTLEELLAEHGNLRARERLVEGRASVVLDYRANSTETNAAEAANFIRARGFKSLRLVTANYHMPRSLMEFHAALPGVTLLPDTVYPELFGRERWWQHKGTRHLLMLEFHKYWAAWLRIHLFTQVPK